MKINTLKLFWIVSVFMLLSISVNGLGFGVTQPGTLIIPAGESQIVEFSVQTGAGDTQDVTAKLEVLNGEEVVELIESPEYFVPASGQTIAKIKINIPKSAQPDDSWRVELAFKAKPIESISTGMVTLGQGIKIGFDVVASEPVTPEIPTGQVTKEVSYNPIYVIIALIVIALVIYLIARKKKSKRKKSRKNKNV